MMSRPETVEEFESAQVAPQNLRQFVFPVVTHVLMFAGLALLLVGVSEFQGVYDELGFTSERPLVMAAYRVFDAIHVPPWIVAVVGLAVDFAILRKLIRARRLSAAWAWIWLVSAVVVATGIFIVWSVFLPLVGGFILKRH